MRPPDPLPRWGFDHVKGEEALEAPQAAMRSLARSERAGRVPGIADAVPDDKTRTEREIRLELTIHV
jgi:hypothetical protein